MRRAALALLLLALGGCAYYNGMYNTKRIAGQAGRAEREGRTLEASGLWGQVVARAESVLVRHPRAGFADEARYLLGVGLARLGDCARAIQPLEAAMRGSRDPGLVESAGLEAGSCYTRLGDLRSAAAAYAVAVGSREAGTRAEARFARGHALSQLREFGPAITELEASSHPRANGERAVALAGAGRVEEAIALADSLLARHDTLVPWPILLDRLRERDPEAASALVSRAAADTTAPLMSRGLMLISDAEYWYPRDSVRGMDRFLSVTALGPALPVGRQGTLRASLARLRHATDSAAFREQAKMVSDFAEVGGDFAAEATRLGGLGTRIAGMLDSVAPGMPNGDLRLFLMAELARDSLEAPRVAAAHFRRLATDWPESPYVPKALLALMALEPSAADSLREELGSRHAESPYVLTLLGTDTPAFQALEDSLYRFAQGGRGAATPVPGARPTPARPQPRQPATPRAPVD